MSRNDRKRRMARRERSVTKAVREAEAATCHGKNINSESQDASNPERKETVRVVVRG